MRSQKPWPAVSTFHRTDLRGRGGSVCFAAPCIALRGDPGSCAAVTARSPGARLKKTPTRLVRGDRRAASCLCCQPEIGPSFNTSSTRAGLALPPPQLPRALPAWRPRARRRQRVWAGSSCRSRPAPGARRSPLQKKRRALREPQDYGGAARRVRGFAFGLRAERVGGSVRETRTRLCGCRRLRSRLRGYSLRLRTRKGEAAVRALGACPGSLAARRLRSPFPARLNLAHGRLNAWFTWDRTKVTELRQLKMLLLWKQLLLVSLVGCLGADPESSRTKMRSTVSVREGQGVVLLCGTPPRAGELSFAWIFNEYPSFVQEDSRRFVSQETGHLYIAKVEPSDVGNYTCVVTSTVTNSQVLGSPTPLVLRTDGVMGEYEPKIEVQFPETLPAAKGSTVKLECFALGNPVPQINWRRTDGLPFPSKIKLRKSNGMIEIPNFQQEDAGLYECITENSRGKNIARGRLTYYDRIPTILQSGQAKPHWIQMIKDTEIAVEDTLYWDCRASGKPKPSYRWLKNGDQLSVEGRIQIENGALTISNLNLTDSGRYQCIAENKHGVIYSSAELRVVASAPDFSKNPMKKTIQVQIGSTVDFECKPKASPKARCSWKKGGEQLHENERITLLKDGGLRVTNVTKADAGSYTCVATNQFGTASGTTNLVVTEPTRIILAPSNMDVTVGESVILPCQVQHDPILDISFTWYFNGTLTDFKKDASHFEKVGGSASGDLMIRNIQLKHSGKYVCMVKTEVDSVASAADLIVRGSPGPPERVRVDEITDTTAQISWQEGTDNHSPVTAYTVQARTPFSVGWQRVTTVPDVIDGNTFTTTVVDLNPWVEYEFRVVASNKIGGGEPSLPSEKVRTEEAVPEIPPAEVSGGGGSRSELVITWDPIPEELQNGEGFGYVVAFRPFGTTTWIQTVVTSPDTPRYVFRNESILPFSPYEVKVGVYNNKGEGPFSSITTVFSAEEEPTVAPSGVSVTSLSSSVIEVSWKAIPWKMSSGRLLGYEVRYWNNGGKEESSNRVKAAGNETSIRITGLKSNLAYYTAVRAYNSAGAGPFSATVNATTKKTPPSQPPGNVVWNVTDSRVILNWEEVRAMENESEVTGYKVLYRTSGQNNVNVLNTDKTTAELLLQFNEDYIIEVKATTEGGDGTSSDQILIPRLASMDARGSGPSTLNIFSLSSILPTVFSFSLNSVL